MRARILLGAALCTGSLFGARSQATPVAAYGFGISDFVEDPSRNIIYGTIPGQNSVAVIDAGTLQVTGTVFVGSNPTGLALDPTGSTLYVADSGSSFISRLDTRTFSLLSSFSSPVGNPLTVRFGNDNRLWVLGGGIGQIDATSGASSGPGAGSQPGEYPLIINAGDIAVSSDGDSLYYGNQGYSPSNAYKYDVSTGTPHQSWVYTGGGNGRGLALSHDGTRFVYSSAGDDNGLQVLRTSDLAVLGSLAGGGIEAFTPNDQYLYTCIDFTFAIHRWSMGTFLESGTPIHANGLAQRMFVDNSAKYLFVGEGSGTEVFRIGPRFATSPAIYSTGVDSDGNTLGDGFVGDPHYTLVSIASASQSMGTRVHDSTGGFPVGPWAGDSANSAWIGPNNNESLSSAPGRYDYRTTFLAPAGAARVKVVGSWAADDSGTDILVNGTSTGLQSTNGFANMTPFTLDEPVRAGAANNLDFLVTNAGTSDNPTGLRVEVNSVLFIPTGDLNSDGKVDFSDLLTLAQHYGTQSGATLAVGDVNGDGRVNFDDLLLLAQNYGLNLNPAAASALAALPEPGAVCCLGLLCLGLRARRR